MAANRPRLFTKSVGLRCLTVKRRKIELLDTVIVCWTESRNIGFFWVDGICGSGQSGTVENWGMENAGVDLSARYVKGGQWGREKTRPSKLNRNCVVLYIDFVHQRKIDTLYHETNSNYHIGIGYRGQGGHVPPKIGGTCFSGNYDVKFGHFSGKTHAIQYFFSGRYNKNSGI